MKNSGIKTRFKDKMNKFSMDIKTLVENLTDFIQKSSKKFLYSGVAQFVKRSTCMQKSMGSIPGW